jgi:hypothetical protein
VRLLPRSLRVRLVVVFAVGACGALVFCLVLLYVLLDRQLWDVLDADLAGRSDDLAAAASAGDVDVVRADPLAQLYAADGRLLAGTPALGDRRLLDVEQVRTVGGEVVATRTLALTPGAAAVPVRLLSQRIGGDRVLAVGVSASPVQAALGRLLVVLLVAAPLLVGVVAVAGWFVVRAALRPVGVLTREAAAISSLDTDRRLPPVPGDDEIAELARTLDGMLARLGVAFARERAFVDDASHELRTPIAVLRVRSSSPCPPPTTQTRWSGRCGPPSPRPRGCPGSPRTSCSLPASGPGRWCSTASRSTCSTWPRRSPAASNRYSD